MKARIFEMEYSCSPGGIDCWELEVDEGIGHSTNYSEFNTAGDALNYLISQYPAVEHEVDITSLEAYHKSMEDENARV